MTNHRTPIPARVPPRRPYNVTDAARVIGVSRDTIYRWVRDGALRAVQPASGAWLIPASEVDRVCGVVPEPAGLRFATSSHQEVRKVQAKKRQERTGLDPAVEAAFNAAPDLDLTQYDRFGNPISSDEYDSWDDGEW